LPNSDADLGELVPEDRTQAVVDLIASVFDRPNSNFTWKDCIPGTFDSLWSWRVNGKIVSALMTRPYTLENGKWGIGIGMVCTFKPFRGKGYASHLTSAVMDTFRSKDASFAILWARKDLCPIYSALGFETIHKDFDYRIIPQDISEEGSISITSEDFDVIYHDGFEAFRLESNRQLNFPGGQENLVRILTNKKWQGLSGARGNRLTIIFGGSKINPSFYGVIIHNHNLLLMLEFMGPPAEFNVAIRYIYDQFGNRPITFSLMPSVAAPYLDRVRVLEKTPSFYTMANRFTADDVALPITTWLDRI
jgi:predicted GNAT family N-acyltransferase